MKKPGLWPGFFYVFRDETSLMTRCTKALQPTLLRRRSQLTRTEIAITVGVLFLERSREAFAVLGKQGQSTFLEFFFEKGTLTPFLELFFGLTASHQIEHPSGHYSQHIHCQGIHRLSH